MQSLSAGDKLGPYEILDVIGKGGMGEVYRARDPRMNREVAVKISTGAFSGRFAREVHTIAALSHPNVCTLHDVGPDYLVMELVEGQTLAERIRHGAFPVDEALGIARQIADALEAAHEKGIVHRDLKPGNVMLRPDGTVKVLDFGLAKFDGGATSSSDDSPTLSMRATQSGVILGTAAYMSPEQARGKSVDKRTDIWAFGVVLYEMVTGKRLFQGEDLTDTVASVVKVDPAMDDVPPPLRRLLRKCLQKDPRKRLRDIGDAWDLLEEPQPPVPVSRRQSSLPWGVAAALMLGLALLAWIHFRETPPGLQAVQFVMDPPGDSEFANINTGVAPSPDGRFIVFSARAAGASAPSLWLRTLDSTTARQLPDTEGASRPFWSPDSRSLAFTANRKVKRIEIAGGAPLTLADTSGSDPSGTWNRDGVILFGSAAGLQRVSASGGGASPLNPDRSLETFPQFLPDGKRFIYFAGGNDPDSRGIHVGNLDDPKERRKILPDSTKAMFVPSQGAYPGYLLWERDRTLMAQPFDVDSLEFHGEAVVVAEEIGTVPLDLPVAYWVSDAGLLTYFSRPSLGRYINWFTRDGKPIGPPVAEGNILNMALSYDGQRLAIARTDAGQRSPDIWIRDLSRDVMTRLTNEPGWDGLPVWSPDGKWLLFSGERQGGLTQLYRKEASGAGQEERLTEGGRRKSLIDGSWDGKYLLFREDAAEIGTIMQALPLDGERKPIVFPFTGRVGAFSPDGRWVAFISSDSGRQEVYVQAFTGVAGAPKGRWQVSNGGAGDLRWRRDGKEIFYQSLDGKMMAAAIQTGPDGVRVETTRVLFSANFTSGSYHQFEVTPDGNRFLLLVAPPAESARLTVMSNWQAALRH